MPSMPASSCQYCFESGEHLCQLKLLGSRRPWIGHQSGELHHLCGQDRTSEEVRKFMSLVQRSPCCSNVTAAVDPRFLGIPECGRDDARAMAQLKIEALVRSKFIDCRCAMARASSRHILECRGIVGSTPPVTLLQHGGPLHKRHEFSDFLARLSWPAQWCSSPD